MSGQPAIFYAALALLAGVFIPIMAALSGTMGRTLGNPYIAAIIVATGAFCIVLAYAALNGGVNATALASLQRATPLQLVSGFAMAFYICSIIYLAPRFGVGNAIMFVVAGQIASSAAIDHFGLFGAPQKPIDALRATGLVIMVIGVIIAQWAANGTKPTH